MPQRPERMTTPYIQLTTPRCAKVPLTVKDQRARPQTQRNMQLGHPRSQRAPDACAGVAT